MSEENKPKSSPEPKPKPIEKPVPPPSEIQTEGEKPKVTEK